MVVFLRGSRLHYGYGSIYEFELKNCMKDMYLESRKLLPLSNVHENSDKRETKKQHHDSEKVVAIWRKDRLLLGFEGVFEPCLGALIKK